MLKYWFTLIGFALMPFAQGIAISQETSRKSTEVNTSRIVIAPPAVTARSLPGDADAPPDPLEIMLQVATRVANDAKRLKWHLVFMPSDTISNVYNAVSGHERKADEDIGFADLRKLADAVTCRYIVVFRVKELVSREDDGVISGRVSNSGIHVSSYLAARASIDLKVYDKNVDKYVWQISKVCETKHRDRNSKNVSLRREQDGALNAAITQALEPFARGERKEVLPSRLDIAVTIKKLLANGKVMIDARRPQNVEVGMTFKSVESDTAIRIVDVLENGSIGEVVGGKPVSGEVFKPK